MPPDSANPPAQDPDPFLAEPFVYDDPAGGVYLAHAKGGKWFVFSWRQTAAGGDWVEVGPISDDEARTSYPRKLSAEEAAAYGPPAAPRPATATTPAPTAPPGPPSGP